MSMVFAGNGRVGFKADEYLSHTCGEWAIMGPVNYEITIFTKTQPGGWTVRFDSRAERDAAALEIVSQLSSSEQSCEAEPTASAEPEKVSEGGK